MQPLDDDAELGSLAQSARRKELKTSRGTLIAVGVLTLLVNGGMGLFARPMVESAFEKEIRQIRQQGQDIDPAQVEQLKEQAIKSTQLISFGFAGVGVVFIVLGAMVQQAPVACTALGLALYLAGWAISAALDPTTIAQGIIIRIIVIVCLVKALQAAIAFQREQADAEFA